MIYDNDPLLTRSITVPSEMSTLSCSAITAGVIEAFMDSYGFVRCQSSASLEAVLMHDVPFPKLQPSRVTAHSVPSESLKNRTVLLIKLSPEVLDRENSMTSK